MKKIVVVLVSFIVAILVNVGNVFAQNKIPEAPPSIPPPYEPPIPEPSLSSEWKLLGIDSDGSTYYINTRNITYLPGGIVKVWELSVPRGEWRRELVDIFKKLFFKGKDPNKAERLWYTIDLYKVNCKNNQFATLEWFVYSFGDTLLYSDFFQNEEWVPEMVDGVVEEYVCK